MRLDAFHRLIWSIFALVLPSFAQAQQLGKPQLAINLPRTEQPAHFDGVQNAVYKIDNHRGCSGFFVSADGHFVTALHCAYKFLLNSSLTVDLDKSLQSQVFYKINEPSTKPFLDITGFRKFDVAPITVRPFVVFMGTGYIGSKPKVDQAQLDKITKDDRLRISGYNEDFVVLKFPTPEPVPCLKVAGELKSGEAVWALGFSAETGHLHISAGLSGNRPADFYQRGLLNGIPIEDLLFDWRKIAAGSMSMLPGMSGGPIVNSKGEAVGVSAMTFHGISAFPRLTYIRAALAKHLGAEPSDRVFNCELSGRNK